MALTMTLNGSNYVSDRTRGAFEQALEESRIKNQESRIKNQESRIENQESRIENRESRIENQESRIKNQESRIEPPTTHNPQPTTHASQLLTPNSQLAMLDHALVQSYEHQTLTMRVHEQYLNNQGEYARLFGQLMQQQGTIFAQAAAIPQQAEMTAAVLETLAGSMARFHDLQEQTLDVHRQFLAQQSDYARATMQLLAGQASGEWRVASGEWRPAIVESPKSKVESLPVHGGETVKRGNGNGNGNGHHPQEAESKTQDAGSTMQASANQPIPQSPNPPTSQSPISQSPISQSPISQSPISQSPNPPISQSLIPSLLAIVSEKTGYPADMLELDMDMEADLGIDSIKRVEILGALQDAHPDLPEVATDVLAELRTLRQIVERMQEAGGKNQESANQRIGESANQQIFNHPIPQSSKKA